MNFETIEYRVATHWLSALINGDTSSLDDEDVAKLEEFEAHVQDSAPDGFYFSSFDYEEGDIYSPDFGRDEVGGFLADVVTVTAYYAPL